MHHRQIEAFKNVMTASSISEAAQHMKVSQSAVSQLITNLEKSLGFKLFTRVKKSVAPTNEAIRFYKYVEKHYFGLEQLERFAEKIRTGAPAELNVCATYSLASSLLPCVLKRFRDQYPDTDLVVETDSSAEIVNRLQTNLIHVAILPAFPETPGIIQEPLMTAAHVCAVSTHHRLADKEMITASDFDNEDVLNVLPAGLVNWGRISEALEQENTTLKRSISIQNSITGYSLIAAGLTIALIEPFAAHLWCKNGVKIIPFEPKLNFDYVIASSNSEKNQQFILDFSKHAKNIAAECGADY